MMRFWVVAILVFLTPSFCATADPKDASISRIDAVAGIVGFGNCKTISQYISEPDGIELSKLPEGELLPKEPLRMCEKALPDNLTASAVWRILPKPSGVGFDFYRLVVAMGRQNGLDFMWIVPHKSYPAKWPYFPGSGGMSGTVLNRNSDFVDWSTSGATLPFVPGKMVRIKFGSSKLYGFTELKPLSGRQDDMYPLRYDSVVIAINGFVFPDPQSYITLMNQSGSKARARRLAILDTLGSHYEVAYFENLQALMNDANSESAQRITYLPLIEVKSVEADWKKLVDTPSGRAMSLGQFGEFGLALFGPLASGIAALDATGWDEDAYQRRKQACRDAGGVC